MNKIVLVIGGAGFLGSNYIHYLLKNYPDYRIINFDSLERSANLHNLDTVKHLDSYYFVQGNCSVFKDMKSIFEQYSPQVVINFADYNPGVDSAENFNVINQTSLTGTYNVLCLCRDNHTEKYIHISTDKVYGSTSAKRLNTEESKLKPVYLHDVLKASADLLVDSFRRSHNLDSTIVRCSNVYGKYQFPDKLIPLVINACLAEKDIALHKDGSDIRDWLYIEDFCSALELIMQNEKSNETFNLGLGYTYKVSEVVQSIIRLMDVKKLNFKINKKENRETLKYHTDISKVCKYFNWKPQYSLERGLDETIKWYKSHQDWLKDIYQLDYIQYNATKLD